VTGLAEAPHRERQRKFLQGPVRGIADQLAEILRKAT
jgi:hypothetical protein